MKIYTKDPVRYVATERQLQLADDLRALGVQRLPISEEALEELADAGRDHLATVLRDFSNAGAVPMTPLEPHEEAALHFALSATLEQFLAAVARNRRHRS